MKRLIPLFLLIFISSCDRSRPVLDLANTHWPEGASVSLIRDGRVAARSPLIGDHVRLQAPKEGQYRVRVAAPLSITALTQELNIVRGANGFTLPNPISRRRVGALKLGMEYDGENSAGLYSALMDTLYASVSSVSVELGKGLNAEDLIYRAHSKAIEIVFRGDCRDQKSLSKAEKYMLALIDSAEVYGAEGLLFIPAGKDGYSGETAALTRRLAASVHERGMSFAVGLDAENLVKFNPVAFFDKVPSPECPDELRILCGLHESTEKETAPVSVEQIGAALVRMHEAKVPLSLVAVEIPLTAFAWRSAGKGRTAPVHLEPGSLENILREAGEGGVIRLGDGSLQLAYKGNTYAFDDLAGIAAKIAFLYSGELSRIRGLYIRYDGRGVKPDGEGLKRLSGVFLKSSPSPPTPSPASGRGGMESNKIHP
ncbi:MAG: hypothetical protein Q8O92_16585 [Candidatus Latescibacter sp.]|nr:hypothetical protein [Candidatus Latescibacter sp.]